MDHFEIDTAPRIFFNWCKDNSFGQPVCLIKNLMTDEVLNEIFDLTEDYAIKRIIGEVFHLQH